MIEEMLLQYGAIGAVCLYLMFDRQVLLKKLQVAIENNTRVLVAVCERLK